MSQDHAAVSGGEGAVTATTGEEGFLTDIDAAGHALLADEPVDVGGTDAGPSPYGLLSAALASCTTLSTSATIRFPPMDSLHERGTETLRRR